jgi:hypothetical protein
MLSDPMILEYSLSPEAYGGPANLLASTCNKFGMYGEKNLFLKHKILDNVLWNIYIFFLK